MMRQEYRRKCSTTEGERDYGRLQAEVQGARREDDEEEDASGIRTV